MLLFSAVSNKMIKRVVMENADLTANTFTNNSMQHTAGF